jgi:hypothetical protein
MSDFDAVLERLVADPAFAATLSADPARALAGYRLSPDEVALLHSQVTGDTGSQRGVETRANQSSVFGLLTPLAGLGGVAGMFGEAPPTQGLGPAGDGQGGGAGFGSAPAYTEGFGPAPVAQGFGPAAIQEGFGAAAPQATAGSVRSGGLAGLAGQLGGQIGGGTAGTGEAPVIQPPEGYRTRVDADGDGGWDRHTLLGTGDGGVDILVDLNSDGRVDFVGHDTNADGLVDSAEFDKDRDGFFEKHSYDDDGDGWLDRNVIQAPPVAPPPGPSGEPPGGGMIGSNFRLPQRD